MMQAKLNQMADRLEKEALLFNESEEDYLKKYQDLELFEIS